MLIFLDVLYTIIHFLLIGFNLTGWLWRKTRKIHLLTLALTAVCWFVLGIWYGWGYCPLTDWHWNVKEKLGEEHLPGSFVKYMADRITGLDINAALIDYITLGCLIGAVIASLYVNFIHVKRKKPEKACI